MNLRHRAIRQRQARTLTRARIAELASIGAWLAGCTCEYELRNLRHAARNLADIDVGHDPDCAAHDYGRQTIIVADDHREPS